MKLKTGKVLRFAALACATVASASMLSGNGSSRAEDGRYIACPLNQANTGLVGRVSHPWWSTSQRGSLDSTHVSNVGGQPTLVCNYRAYNRTMPVLRRFPKNVKSCKPQGNGFRCW